MRPVSRKGRARPRRGHAGRGSVMRGQVAFRKQLLDASTTPRDSSRSLASVRVDGTARLPTTGL